LQSCEHFLVVRLCVRAHALIKVAFLRGKDALEHGSSLSDVDQIQQTSRMVSNGSQSAVEPFGHAQLLLRAEEAERMQKDSMAQELIQEEEAEKKAAEKKKKKKKKKNQVILRLSYYADPCQSYLTTLK